MKVGSAQIPDSFGLLVLIFNQMSRLSEDVCQKSILLLAEAGVCMLWFFDSGEDKGCHGLEHAIGALCVLNGSKLGSMGSMFAIPAVDICSALRQARS